MAASINGDTAGPPVTGGTHSGCRQSLHDAGRDYPRHDVDTALTSEPAADPSLASAMPCSPCDDHRHFATCPDFATFNILLNAPSVDVDPANLSDRVTVLAGNMLEPLAGQTFDLVVTNPRL